MTAQTVLADLLASGIEPGLTHDKTGIVVPAGRLTPDQRQAVLDHKKELIEYLVESSRLATRLMAAAMRRCDQFNDGEAAREAMRQDILATQMHLRQDLLDHFNQIAKDPKP